MGNTQLLPNGDVFVGWGEVPFFSEYTTSGKLLFDAAFPSPDMSYRAYVQPWVGKPLYAAQRRRPRPGRRRRPSTRAGTAPPR